MGCTNSKVVSQNKDATSAQIQKSSLTESGPGCCVCCVSTSDEDSDFEEYQSSSGDSTIEIEVMERGEHSTNFKKRSRTQSKTDVSIPVKSLYSHVKSNQTQPSQGSSSKRQDHVELQTIYIIPNTSHPSHNNTVISDFESTTRPSALPLSISSVLETIYADVHEFQKFRELLAWSEIAAKRSKSSSRKTPSIYYHNSLTSKTMKTCPDDFPYSRQFHEIPGCMSQIPFLLPIAEVYGLTISILPPGPVQDALYGNLVNAKPPSMASLLLYAPILVRQLKLYPPLAFKKFRVSRIILTQDLCYGNQPRKALPVMQSQTMYVDCRGNTLDFLASVFHHELFHMFDDLILSRLKIGVPERCFDPTDDQFVPLDAETIAFSTTNQAPHIPSSATSTTSTSSRLIKSSPAYHSKRYRDLRPEKETCLSQNSTISGIHSANQRGRLFALEISQRKMFNAVITYQSRSLSTSTSPSSSYAINASDSVPTQLQTPDPLFRFAKSIFRSLLSKRPVLWQPQMFEESIQSSVNRKVISSSSPFKNTIWDSIINNNLSYPPLLLRNQVHNPEYDFYSDETEEELSQSYTMAARRHNHQWTPTTDIMNEEQLSVSLTSMNDYFSSLRKIAASFQYPLTRLSQISRNTNIISQNHGSSPSFRKHVSEMLQFSNRDSIPPHELGSELTSIETFNFYPQSWMGLVLQHHQRSLPLAPLWMYEIILFQFHSILKKLNTYLTSMSENNRDHGFENALEAVRTLIALSPRTLTIEALQNSLYVNAERYGNQMDQDMTKFSSLFIDEFCHKVPLVAVFPAPPLSTAETLVNSLTSKECQMLVSGRTAPSDGGVNSEAVGSDPLWLLLNFPGFKYGTGGQNMRDPSSSIPFASLKPKDATTIETSPVLQMDENLSSYLFPLLDRINTCEFSKTSVRSIAQLISVCHTDLYKNFNATEFSKSCGCGGDTSSVLGFFNQYATSAIEEDKAETYSALIRTPTVVLRSQDPFLRAKAHELLRRLSIFDEHFDESFIQNLFFQQSLGIDHLDESDFGFAAKVQSNQYDNDQSDVSSFWEIRYVHDGTKFWCNTKTKKTSWTIPTVLLSINGPEYSTNSHFAI